MCPLVYNTHNDNKPVSTFVSLMGDIKTRGQNEVWDHHKSYDQDRKIFSGIRDQTLPRIRNLGKKWGH